MPEFLVRSTLDVQAANGTQSLANSPGALFRFTFDGNAVTYYFTKAYNRGKAVVTIDGVDKGVVDMYSPTVERQQSQTYSGLGTGTHIINVLVTGTQNSQSIGAFVDVDQLVVQ